MSQSASIKMLAGELYDAGDSELVRLGTRAGNCMQVYNQTARDKAKREVLLQRLLSETGNNTDIQLPFIWIMAAILK